MLKPLSSHKNEMAGTLENIDSWQVWPKHLYKIYTIARAK